MVVRDREKSDSALEHLKALKRLQDLLRVKSNEGLEDVKSGEEQDDKSDGNEERHDEDEERRDDLVDSCRYEQEYEKQEQKKQDNLFKALGFGSAGMAMYQRSMALAEQKEIEAANNKVLPMKRASVIEPKQDTIVEPKKTTAPSKHPIQPMSSDDEPNVEVLSDDIAARGDNVQVTQGQSLASEEAPKNCGSCGWLCSN